jgi:HEAT repeat protein
VTTLDATGPGSLAEACAAKGPRTVVFDVSGVIRAPKAGKGRRRLYIRHGKLTLAGQTAPGKGITIEGALRTLGKGCDDIIIRFLRFRPDCYAPAYRPVATHNHDCIGINWCERAILDHCSFSWANDECVDLINSKHVTLQWCTIEESDIQWEGGDEPHNFALIVGYTGGWYSVHHNLIAHHHSRAPAYTALKHECDVRNNVMYNFGTSTSTGFGNVTGNYSKDGPGAPWAFPRIYHPPATLTLPDVSVARRGKSYLRGNFLTWNGGYVDVPTSRYAAAKAPLPVAPVSTHVAEEAYDRVLAHAGCLPHDEITGRTVQEVRTRAGAWGRHDPPGDWRERLAGGAAKKDTDRDGMPDAWEKDRGLDPADPKDANRTVPAGASKGDRHKGYTHLEFYLNELADLLVARARTEARLRPVPGEPPHGPDPEKPFKPIAELVKDITSQSMDRKKTDTEGSFYAIQNLGRMGPGARAAVPALVEALDTDDRRKAVFVAWALGAIGPHARDAVPALIRALNRPYPVKNTKWEFNPDGFVAWALGRIGPDAKEAVPLLAAALHGEDVWARRPAAWALAQMGPEAEPAADALIGALKYSSGGAWSAMNNVQFHAAEALAGIGEPVVPKLGAALKARDAATRRGAALALGKIGPKAGSAAPDLAALLSDEAGLVRIEALTALSRVDPAAAVKALPPLLNDENYAVRHAAAAALGTCGPTARDAIAALERALGDARPEVRRAAYEALGRIGREAVAVLARAAVGRQDTRDRAWAARALGETGQGAVPALSRALSDRAAGVRCEAAWSLARIGPPAKDALDALKAAAQDPDVTARVAAEEAVKRIAAE